MSGYTNPDPCSVEENGRTYSGYREGKYLLPNDGPEQDRLDLEHRIWCLLLDEALYLAPFRETKNEKKTKKEDDDDDAAADDDRVYHVLDIGAGTGVWAAELARENPDVRVIGTDLSLIQPPPDKLPPNCRFVREDSEADEWVHEAEFDYIHTRAMLGSFFDHKAMFKKMYDNLRPGGWCEAQDWSYDMVAADAATEAMLPDSSVIKWQDLMDEGIKMAGRDLRVAKHYEHWMNETGFVDVTQKLILCPINPWPLDPKDKEIARYFIQDTIEALEGMSMRILQLKGMTPEEIRTLTDKVKQDLTNRDLHAYTPVYVVYGRRPLDGETDQTGSYPSPS